MRRFGAHFLYYKYFSKCAVHADFVAGVYLGGCALAAYYCGDAEFSCYYSLDEPCAGLALAYAYIRLALAFMDCFVR